MNVSQEIYETDRAIDELAAVLDYCDNTGNAYGFIRKETLEKALSALSAYPARPDVWCGKWEAKI